MQMTTAKRGKRRRLYEQAVAALLSSTDCKAAAASCGVSYSTLLRWQQEPEFIKLYNDAKRDILEGVKNGLRQLGMKAVGTLNTSIDDTTVATSDKLNASKYVLNCLMAMEITEDLASRIAAIEGEANA
jgi:hypothetical protein